MLCGGHPSPSNAHPAHVQMSPFYVIGPGGLLAITLCIWTNHLDWPCFQWVPMHNSPDPAVLFQVLAPIIYGVGLGLLNILTITCHV